MDYPRSARALAEPEADLATAVVVAITTTAALSPHEYV